MLALTQISAITTTPTLHCSDPAAANYQSIPDGVAAPWLCTYLAYGCGDPLADNFDPDVDVLAASMCMFAGCNDTDATNFDGRATFNDGSCRYERPRAKHRIAGAFAQLFGFSVTNSQQESPSHSHTSPTGESHRERDAGSDVVVERAAAGALLHHYADAVPIFAVWPVRVRRCRR